MGTEGELGTVGVGRREIGPAESAQANRLWWDADAAHYHAEHGSFLGTDDFVWCPERLREDEAQLLGGPGVWHGKRVLEVGSGSAMCSRWLAARGARPIAFDVSFGMLSHDRDDSSGVRLVQADAQHLPFAEDSIDLAFTAYGAVPFVADSAGVMREVARVLRPGGRWVFSTTHPIRWSFPDDPGEEGLTASMSYFDRRPYVEFDTAGTPTYVEHHRTLGDRVRELVAAGFILVDLVEPEWPAELDQDWGGWSPLRGKIIPGTAIFVCERP
ncbi:class I SAM-dependent methyltransferase [Jatrophihabitans telluris]|uniref:Class I SAM-dependent methyltransferase n=1 Tax=Jatrophihabitans telluris TaxID=2038343 RepID=A0ABY4QTZ5_9ACTN|nr:class I SAM-dependent methyltransferase [Jatrophihabitans telluris]UQX87125.1 class I SAM-dependent methyltransferase [Jatrophihabitans telluris]